MKTTLLEESKLCHYIKEVSLDAIAFCSNVLPIISKDDNNKTSEIIVCDSISGGADEINNMPAHITLTKLEYINGELHKFEAKYKIVEK